MAAKIIHNKYFWDEPTSDKTLNAISPLQTLERGYSITLNDKEVAIHSVKQIKPDDKIKTRLFDGHIISSVESCTVIDE